MRVWRQQHVRTRVDARTHLEPRLIVEATVLLQGVVEAAAMGLVCRRRGVEAVVVCKHLPSLEHARSRVNQRAVR